jgi:hypothetical protein
MVATYINPTVSAPTLPLGDASGSPRKRKPRGPARSKISKRKDKPKRPANAYANFTRIQWEENREVWLKRKLEAPEIARDYIAPKWRTMSAAARLNYKFI